MQPKFRPIVTQAPQRSEEWFRARLGNVTASRANDVMAYAKPTKTQLTIADEFYTLNSKLHDQEWKERMREEYPTEYCLQADVELKEMAARANYRQELVAERITGMQADENNFVNRAAQWGIMNEIYARAEYSMRTGNFIKDAPFMSHPEMMCGASPDGFVTDAKTGELGNAEIKCLMSKNHLYKIVAENTIPDEYIAQVQMQMWVAGMYWCDFIGYDSRVKNSDIQMVIVRVERDDFYIDNVLVPAIERFLDECDHDERKFYAISKARERERLGV